MIRFLVSAVAAVYLAGSALAAQDQLELVLNPYMHNSAVRDIALDGANGVVYTASEDGTVKIWSQSDGTLYNTLHVPSYKNRTAKLFAVDVNRHNNLLAVGGSTSPDFKNFHIYLFDRKSGGLKRVVEGLPDTITTLKFSADGNYLAAGMAGAKGIVIFSTQTWKAVLKDAGYQDDVYGLDFSPQGALATTSFDGFIRQYNSSFELKHKQKPQGGSKPYSIRYSPTDAMLLVGFVDSRNIEVLDSNNLSSLYMPDTLRVDNGNLGAVAWSADGRSVYAGGGFDAGKGTVIIRWDGQGKGGRTASRVGSNTISKIILTPDGDMLFATFDPSFGIYDAKGKNRFAKASAAVDFRESNGRLQFSTDGKKLLIPQSPKAGNYWLFDLEQLNLTEANGSEASFIQPVTTDAGARVEYADHSDGVRINNKSLTLAKGEKVRSHAILPELHHVLAGADWSLRYYKTDGSQLWARATPGAAWAVNFSSDNRFAVAAFADGTIRWYEIDSGKEQLALFIDKLDLSWVAWTPQGYFNASPGAESYIGWKVTKAGNQKPDFYSLNRFREQYYNHDLLQQVLFDANAGVAAGAAIKETGSSTKPAAQAPTQTQPQTVPQALPPVITILSHGPSEAFQGENIRLVYEVAEKQGNKLKEVRVLLDGRPVSKERGLVRAKPTGTKANTVDLTLPKRDVTVTLIAEGEKSVSEPATIHFTWTGAKSAGADLLKPVLYVLAIGISDYKDPDLKLNFASKDAADFAGSVKKQQGALYRKVEVKLIPDATRDQVLDGLDWLQNEVTARDVAMVFLAGHGVNDRNGEYFFLPANVNLERLKTTGVTYHAIKQTITNLPGKSLFFVDTCHSGNILGPTTRRGVFDVNGVVMDLTSAENGVVVFASSTGKQYSLENPSWNNGAFTKALVEGLSGKADLFNTSRITINTLDAYIANRVKELTQNKQTPTTSKPATIQDFPIAVKLP